MSINGMLEQATWSQKITMLRNLSGMTQLQLAEKIGTTQKVIWMWENGKSEPRRLSKSAIARAFEVKESEIFN